MFSGGRILERFVDMVNLSGMKWGHYKSPKDMSVMPIRNAPGNQDCITGVPSVSVAGVCRK